MRKTDTIRKLRAETAVNGLIHDNFVPDWLREKISRNVETWTGQLL